MPSASGCPVIQDSSGVHEEKGKETQEEEVVTEVLWGSSEQNLGLLTVPLCPRGNQTEVEDWLAL